MILVTKVDDLELYEVAGDIVGGMGWYVNRLKEINRRLTKAISACKELENLNGKKVVETSRVKDVDANGKITFHDNKKTGTAHTSSPLGELTSLSSNIERCIEEISTLQKDANKCEYIADAVKHYRKKIEKKLSPDDRAKYWHDKGLSPDMYAAKSGDTVGISDKGADWDGDITFERMPNGTYRVLKNGIPVGYTTAKVKKDYYRYLLNQKGNEKYKKKYNKGKKEKSDKEHSNDSIQDDEVLKRRDFKERQIEDHENSNKNYNNTEKNDEYEVERTLRYNTPYYQVKDKETGKNIVAVSEEAMKGQNAVGSEDVVFDLNNVEGTKEAYEPRFVKGSDISYNGEKIGKAGGMLSDNALDKNSSIYHAIQKKRVEWLNLDTTKYGVGKAGPGDGPSSGRGGKK